MTETVNKRQKLTIKRGILAIVIMYASQLIAGTVISYAFKITKPTDQVPIEIIGLASILLSGIIILTFFWWDIRRSGEFFHTEIGLQPSKIAKSKGLLLVLSALVSTHLLAWVYRSVILPAFGQEKIIGGGSKMFRFIQTNGGSVEMFGFLLLAPCWTNYGRACIQGVFAVIIGQKNSSLGSHTDNFYCFYPWP